MITKTAILTVPQNSDAADFEQLANADSIISVERKSTFLGDTDFRPIYTDWQSLDRFSITPATGSSPAIGSILIGWCNGHFLQGELLRVTWQESVTTTC